MPSNAMLQQLVEEFRDHVLKWEEIFSESIPGYHLDMDADDVDLDYLDWYVKLFEDRAAESEDLLCDLMLRVAAMLLDSSHLGSAEG